MISFGKKLVRLLLRKWLLWKPFDASVFENRSLVGIFTLH